MKFYFLFLWLLLTTCGLAQQKINAVVVDIDSDIPLAFAKVLYNNNSFLTDWEGKISIEITNPKNPLQISFARYFTKYAYVNEKNNFMVIKMVQNPQEKYNFLLTDNKVNKIVKKVIENKKNNDVKHVFKSFDYKNYEYLYVSGNADSISGKIDTIYKKNIFGITKKIIDSSEYKLKKVLNRQHIYQTEKINHISFYNKKSQEKILAARMAGFKQPLYEYLGLQLMSYSAYDNPFEILTIPVQNPISSFGRKWYNYHLIDSTSLQNRKVYKVYFEPKHLKKNRLRGLLYIDAETFAVAKAFYRIYGNMQINADYLFTYLTDKKIWMPKKRNITVNKADYVDDIKFLGNSNLQFNSGIEVNLKKHVTDQLFLKLESTVYDINLSENNKIYKNGLQIIVPQESLQEQENWFNQLKKDTIDNRKINTYISIDSLSKAGNIEKKIILGKKIINGYLPISYVDVDLRSLIKFNNHEGFRLGVGAVTNQRLSSKYKVAFYGAYGLKDNDFKYGIAPSYNIHKNSETWLTASYSSDIDEIGKIKFATDVSRYKIYDPRPFNIGTFYNNDWYSISIETKILPKTYTKVSINNEFVQPLFNYTFINKNNNYSNYNITTAQLAFQFNPLSKFMQTPQGRIEYQKKNPKLSLQFTQTIPNVLNNDFNFTKIDAKTFYEFPYLSGHKSSVLLQGGLAYGDVPITHLYSIAPNNLNRDAILQRVTFAGNNSFETMYFNEFFSNKYLAVHLKHTFNKTPIAYKINPEFSVITRFAYGTINKKNTHIGATFNTLENGFFESGVEANKIFKGLGLSAFYRYGAYQLPRFDENIAIKITFNLDLGI